jgi:hypothetical protein
MRYIPARKHLYDLLLSFLGDDGGEREMGFSTLFHIQKEKKLTPRVHVRTKANA